jgi:hypothetical protein
MVSHHAATSAIVTATPSCARHRGRTNVSAAIAHSPNTAARGRRNAETGKSNQSAPKAHARPISNTNQLTLKRSKRTKKCTLGRRAASPGAPGIA